MFTSSVDAYVPPEPFPSAEVTEDQTPKPHQFLMGPYGESKFNSDKLVIQANNSLLPNGKRLKTCSLRIPFSYGEGDVKAEIYIRDAMKNRRLILFGSQSSIVHKMYAGNAAWAHVLAVHKLGHPIPSCSPAGRSMFVGDHTPYLSFCGHYVDFAKRAGLTIGPTIPFKITLLISILVDITAWLLSPIYTFRSDFKRSGIQFTANDYTVSWELSRKCLGYAPIFSYADAIDKSWVYLKKTVVD